MLVDFTLNGQTVKAVAQPTKQSICTFRSRHGQAHLAHRRETCGLGDVLGEKYSPTQPMPAAAGLWSQLGTSATSD
jgi:glucose dehydrogenase